MDLIEAMYEALTGRQSDEHMGFGELLARLAGVAGSGAAAARVLGIAPTTFYRWRAGRQRPRTGAGVIRSAIRRLSLSAALEADIRAKRKTMRIVGVVQVSKDSRLRTLNVGAAIPARKMGNVINAWKDGDDNRASRLLWRAIDQHYVEDIEITQLIRVEFR